MKIPNTRTWGIKGILILLTALVCYGVQDKRPKGYDTIHEAAAKGDVAAVRAFLEKGTYVNAKDQFGCTALLRAAEYGRKVVAELLIAKGADVNARADAGWAGGTPLCMAAFERHWKVAELLIAKGADVNAKDHLGETPLHIAAQWGQREVAKLLIAKGADVNARNKARGDLTPLHVSATREVAELLVAKGANINAKDYAGVTPLHDAASQGHKEVAEFLLAKGADVNAKADNGRTPLHQAADGGFREVAKLLVAKGADVNAKDNSDETPLHRAANEEGKDFRLIWVSDTPPPPRKVAAIAEAADRDFKELAEFLLARGADANAKDKAGKTPLKLAEERGNDVMVALLKKHGAK